MKKAKENEKSDVNSVSDEEENRRLEETVAKLENIQNVVKEINKKTNFVTTELSSLRSSLLSRVLHFVL